MSFLGHLEGSNGVHQKLYQEHDDTLTVKSTEDVEPLLNENKRLYGLNDGYTKSRDMRRVASIPLVLVHAWQKKGVNIFNSDHWPRIAHALDSREFLHLRTAPGRVSSAPHRVHFTGYGSRGTKSELEL
jgi:hypothetical protein